MKSVKSMLAAAVVLFAANQPSIAQNPENEVIITGVRFTYPLVEKWIKDYKTAHPDANVRIETRTATDPEKYDLLIEAYDQDQQIKDSREYISIGRYALLPVANAKSGFAKEYGDKGLNEKTYKQIYFHDVYAEKDKSLPTDYTVYTRLQKAGAPVTFAKYFGYEQQQIKGKAIAGADEHLIKALLKDETGVSYTTPGLAYDLQTRKPLDGLRVIPVDFDGNGRVSKEEKEIADLDQALTALSAEKIKNVPIEYIHLSIGKSNANPEAKKFLIWVAENSDKDLQQFGYLKPDAKKVQDERAKLAKLAAVK